MITIAIRKFRSLAVRLALIAIGLVACANPDCFAQKAPVDFAQDVFPILQRSCIECHGAEKQEAGLRLDTRDETLDSGAVEPGDPGNSELLRRVLLPAGHDELMPAIGAPLPKKQASTLRRWIKEGADWPADFEPSKHWAYVAPLKAVAPVVSNTEWGKSPIDQFVLARLESAELRPAPKAEPEKLVRRLYLDLIGLPPTPDEVQAFVRDPTDRNFEVIVDDLLGRPQFGERWARPWLDLARYADSHGFQRDNFRDVWAYRDWVIRALNDDLPFDQFTIEQVAGDLLPNATESQRVATGFHRCTPTNVEAGSLPEETRIEQVIDRVNTTGAVWLGTTLECCQCHDHKYDPFSQKEYYQLLAFFNNTQKEADRTDEKKPSSIKFSGPTMDLSDAEQDRRRVELEQQLAELKSQQKELRQQLSSDLASWVEGARDKILDAPKTYSLEITDFQSSGGTDSHRRLEDGSILLVGGDPPDKDDYLVRARASVTGVTAIRLDALLDDSLPKKGPGRSDRRNFVLNEIEAQLVSRADDVVVQSAKDEVGKASEEGSVALAFSGSTADFSQGKFPVQNAHDGDLKSGWAISPQQGKPHWAMFRLEQPIDLTDGNEMAVTLKQRFGRALTIGRLKLSVVTGAIGRDAVSDVVVAAAKKRAADWTPADRKELLTYRVGQDAESAELGKQVASLRKKIDQIAPDTTLVMIELDQPRMTAVFDRGDYRNPGQQVQPMTPDVLHDFESDQGNRLTLARWLVSRDNPVVARVTVNRWWAELFGSGIVTTLEDFGIKGEPPSHPALLDWLAVELMDNGWSMKKLLKTIVMSSTYQQSSNVRYEVREIDPENRLLSRGPRFRMDAEMVRDNALAISGLLSLTQLGPSIRPYQPDGIWSKVGGESYAYEVSPGSEKHRRGIYVVVKRGSPYPSFVNFDATPRLACTVKRSRTNTPLQALTLLNDPVYVEAAKALCERIRVDRSGASLDQQLEYAFQLCTARRPNESERATLHHLYRQQADAEDPLYGIATALLNLHETITKD